MRSSADEGYERFARTAFSVTPESVASAMHDHCPLRTCRGRPWNRCSRASNLLTYARSLLERAVEHEHEGKTPLDLFT